MAHKRTELGFGHTLLLGVVIVVAVLAFVAYRVVNNQDSSNTPTASQKTSTAAAPSTIKSNDDLSKTQAAINGSPVESDLNPAELNDDVNNLL